MSNSSGNGKPPRREGDYAPFFLVDTERWVLGAMLLEDAESAQVFSMLDATDFSRQDYQTVFRRMQALHKRGEPIDRVTVATELEQHRELKKIGGLTFLLSLDEDLPRNSHPVRYAQKLRERAAHRRAIVAADLLAKQMLNPDADPRLVFAEYHERMERILEAADPGAIDLVERIPTLAGYQIQTRYLVEDLIVESAVTLVTGSYGDGKSTFAMALADAVARGGSILGRATIQRPVIVIDRENGIDVVKDRMLRLGVRDDLHPLRVWGLWGDASGRQPPGPDATVIIEYARRARPLVIWDSLVAFAGCDENSAAEMRRHLQHYRRLAALGATILILHHASEKSENGVAYRGSTDIPAAVDSAFLLSRDDGSSAGDPLGRMLVRPFKTRISPQSPLRIEYVNGKFLPVDAPPPAADQVLANLLRAYPGSTQGELVKQAMQRGVAKHKAAETIERMVLEGRAKVQRNKHNTMRFYPPDAGPQLVN